MEAKKAQEFLEETKHQFLKWRESRRSMTEKIPEPLWEKAVKLSEDYSRSFVAKTLGLDHTSFRKRLGVAKRGYKKAATLQNAIVLPRMAQVIPVIKAEASRQESNLLFEVESSGLMIRFYR